MRLGWWELPATYFSIGYLKIKLTEVENRLMSDSTGGMNKKTGDWQEGHNVHL